MSASPEFYKPAAAPAFSPPCAAAPASDYDYYGSSSCCRTPTGSGITYLREPTTCPPAPRKPPPPPPCRKRLFQPEAEAEATVISLRLDELERLFRPHPPNDKPRRSRSRSRSARKHDDSSTKLPVNSS